MNTIGYFEIQSGNLQKTMAFYQSVFGWQFIKEELVPIEYYRIETGGAISGGLLQRPAAPPPAQSGTNAFVCSIEVESFDRVAETILQQGGWRCPSLPFPAAAGRAIS